MELSFIGGVELSVIRGVELSIIGGVELSVIGGWYFYLAIMQTSPNVNGI